MFILADLTLKKIMIVQLLLGVTHCSKCNSVTPVSNPITPDHGQRENHPPWKAMFENLFRINALFEHYFFS